VIKSFLLFHSTVAPIIFILVCSKFFHQSFFTPPPPGSCLVTHFSLSSTLFTFLTCFSQLASLPVCVCSLCGLWSLLLGELD
jgi:hypothetical protein